MLFSHNASRQVFRRRRKQSLHIFSLDGFIRIQRVSWSCPCQSLRLLHCSATTSSTVSVMSEPIGPPSLSSSSSTAISPQAQVSGLLYCAPRSSCIGQPDRTTTVCRDGSSRLRRSVRRLLAWPGRTGVGISLPLAKNYICRSTLFLPISISRV